MLENDGVGARSGINPVFGSARSQKYRNVRCWTSSSNAPSEVRGVFVAHASGNRRTSRRDAGSFANRQKLTRRPICSRRPSETTQLALPRFGLPSGGRKLVRHPSFAALKALNTSAITPILVPRKAGKSFDK